MGGFVVAVVFGFCVSAIVVRTPVLKAIRAAAREGRASAHALRTELPAATDDAARQAIIIAQGRQLILVSLRACAIMVLLLVICLAPTFCLEMTPSAENRYLIGLAVGSTLYIAAAIRLRSS